MSILNKLQELKNTNIYPFHMPGHKRRLFASNELQSLYEIDITEIDGFDNLHNAQGIIKEAEDRAAKLFGAYETHFLVNGTTSGILAAVVGSVRDGDTVIMARNCHKCVYNAVMLSGAAPLYIYPDQEAYCEVNAGIRCEQVEEALQKASGNKGGNILVVITSPTYEGIASDVEGIANICHSYGATLLVDAAHGSHFGMSDSFPKSVVACGADVVVTSIHKTLPAPTQTSLIHIAQGVKSAERIRQMLTVFQSSSPSYVLMAGIDSCIELLEQNGASLFEQYASRLDDFYKAMEGLESIGVLTKDKLTRSGSYDFDYGKIIIYDKTGTVTGASIYRTLLDVYNIQPEMAAGSYVVLMTSVADDEKGFDRLTSAIIEIDSKLTQECSLPKARNFIKKIYDKVIAPCIKEVLFPSDNDEYLNKFARENEAIVFGNLIACDIKSDRSIKDAVWEDGQYIPVELSEGKVSAGYVMFYPPGIPIVAPGEVLTDRVVDTILEGKKNGLTIDGLNDNGEIKVLWEKSST